MSDQLFSRAGVRYEVACDILGSIIAHYAEVIGLEREKERPNEEAIATAEAAQRELRGVRDDLDSKNSAAIEAVIQKYSPEARRLYGR